MVGFVLRRGVLGALVLAVLSLVSFRFVASVDANMQLHPWAPQYWAWLEGLFTGTSLHVLNEPAASIFNSSAGTTLLDSIGHTLALLVATFVLVFVLAVGLGLLASVRRGSFADVALRGVSYLAWSIPAFLLALLVQRALYLGGGDYGYGPFPVAGWPGSCPVGLGLNVGTLSSCPSAGTGFHYLANVLRYIALPSVTLAAGYVGLHGRYLRTALVDTLQAPFVVTARGKGLTERRVVLRHALRASLPTFVSAILSDMGAIFGSALAVDYIFGLNGLGTTLVSDFPPADAPFTNGLSVQMLVMLAGLLVLASSFLAEVTVALLDPRRRGPA